MYTAKQMIVMRRDLHMRKGKNRRPGRACLCHRGAYGTGRENRLGQVYTQGMASACGRRTARHPLSDWFQHGTAKVCVYVDSEEALLDLDRRAKEAGILSALICDAGMTEFHGQPTFTTCLALEPLPPEQVDPLTGELPLY